MTVCRNCGTRESDRPLTEKEIENMKSLGYEPDGTEVVCDSCKTLNSFDRVNEDIGKYE